MKKIVCFALFALSSGFLCSAVFASGKADLTLINKTGAEIEEIIVHDITDNKTESHIVALGRGGSATVKVKKGNYFNITMVDVNMHQYGIQNRRYLKDSNEQQISHYDYVFEGIGPFFRRILGR